ncbi:MAG: DNA repair protein RadC, partial [Mucispirillum sp.]|nr:DNA repair protein RadC [Mucispirillum sp.]
MEKEHYLGHRKRLKEKFDEAPSVLSDYEIVELLLGYVITRRDVKPLAKDILQAAGSIGNIFALEHSSIKGAGPETERFFNAVRELYNRIERSKIISSESISSPEQVYRMLKYSIAFASNERFAAILLNSKNKVLDISVMTEGIVNAAIVYPRQVAEYALKNKAAGVIIAHN